LELDLKDKTMAIQGFGNAGQYAALLGHEMLGLKLVAASDSKGGIYNEKGLDPKKVVDHKLRTGSLQGFRADHQQRRTAGTQCDRLIPSALEA
jgi:glutamate dehydrogenase (NAD(P)+)